MELSPIVSYNSISCCVLNTADTPKTTRSALSASSHSSRFESISTSILDLFLKAWEFLKGLFCCVATVREPEIIYKPVPQVSMLTGIIEIQGNKFEAFLDTGCRPTLVLQNKCLKKISKKTQVEDESIKNYTGQALLKNRYRVSEANLAGVIFNEVIITEYDEDLSTFMDFGGMDGLIGLPFFERIGSYFMDMPNNKSFNHEWGKIDKIEQMGYSFSNFVKIPLNRSHNGLLNLQVETDFGRFTFIFDTGSSASLIRPSLINVQKYEKMTPESMPFWTTSIFKIGGKDFGSTSLALRETDPAVTYDGILGMDFLLERVFDLDVKRGTLFIGESLKKD